MARTREQQREYMRTYRAGKLKSSVPEQVVNVTDIKAPRFRPTADSGSDDRVDDFAGESIEDAVAREIGAMPNAKEQPGKVAVMMQLARVIADDESIPQRAPNAKLLLEMMTELRGAEVTGGSKLAQLRGRREGKSA